MKTFVLLCLACLFVCCSAHSQISKGSVLLGGNLSFTTSDHPDAPVDYKNNSYNISPSFGLVVKENKVWGLNLGYSHNINKVGSDFKNEYSGYGVGIFYRSYLPLGKSFYLYGQGQLNANHAKSEQTSGGSFHKSTSKGLELNLFPGLAYAVSKRFHFEIALNNLVGMGYSSTKEDNTTVPGTKSSQFGFYANANPASNLSLGFRILLGNK